MRTVRGGRTMARAATVAMVAALAVGVSGPTAHAGEPEVDAALVPVNSTSVLLTGDRGSQFSMDLVVPAADPPVGGTATVTVTVDFAAVSGSITITDHSPACDAQGSGYVCHYPVPQDSDSTHRIFFSMAALEAAEWVNGTVPATAEVSGATDPDPSNNSIDFHIDVRTNLVDVTGAPNGDPYYVVKPDGTHLSVMVATPNARTRVTLRATFDLSAVSHAIEAAGEFAPDADGCVDLGGHRYRCDVPVGSHHPTPDTLTSIFGFTAVPVASATAGVAGQVRVDVEQVGAVDPDLSNNRVFLTVDVAVGHTETRFDTGEATGRIGDTVTVPVTMTNQGSDSVRFAAISYGNRSDGLEFAGYEGCVDNEFALPGMCSSPLWLAAGDQHTVGIRLTIRRCPDSTGFRPNMAAGAGEIVRGTIGRVNVIGCGGTASSGPGTAGSPGAPAVVDDGASAAPDGPDSASSGGGDSVSTGGGDSAAGAAPDPRWAAPDGDWVAVGEHRRPESGLGGFGLLALLVLLAAGQGWRWRGARGA
jgi:hypothetical protein